MSRIFSILTVLSILSLGLAASSQANSMAQRGFTTYDTTKLIGLTLKSREGTELGQIFDFVVDSNGHVDFAMVLQPSFDEFTGRLVVIPFSTIVISKGKSDKISVVFNAYMQKFYESPDWSNINLADMKQAASVYRYYGVQPYWTGAPGKAGSHEWERKILPNYLNSGY